jgi:hypothetical protein
MRAAGGSLMQCAVIHGAGRFGTADHAAIADRPEVHAPFQAELLAFALLRRLARDLLDHAAAVAGGPRAARLDPRAARALGLGWTPGPDLAGFPVAHPCLFNNWVLAREEAMDRVRSLGAVAARDWRQVAAHAARMSRATGPAEARLAQDLARLGAEMAAGPQGARPWARLMAWAGETLHEEGQEALGSLALEPYGGLVDGLGHCMSDRLDRDFRIDGALPVARVRALIAEVFGWALGQDWSGDAPQAWYSAAPWAGPRPGPALPGAPPGAAWPFATARDAALAHRALSDWPGETPVAAFLLRHPEHRVAVRRAQITGFAPYAEIRDDMVAAGMRPDGPMRATLAFLGATGFRPGPDGGLSCLVFAGDPEPGAEAAP